MTAVNTIKNVIEHGHTVAIWGASLSNQNIINNLKCDGINVCSIIDSDFNKHGLTFLGIPIRSFDETMELYNDLYLWITESSWKYNVIGKLVNEKQFPKERIINYEPVIWKRACPYVENFLSWVTDGVESCCVMGGRNRPPRVNFNGDYEKTIDQFIETRKQLSRSIENGDFTSCGDCFEIKEGYFAVEPKITRANYSCGGICNLQCVYCKSLSKQTKCDWNKTANIEKVYDILKRKELISEYFYLDIAPGEPVLHKNKEQFYRLVRLCSSSTFYTNATVFDEKLAECLKNESANICVSIDCGNRESYKMIKGVDLFEKVLNNITRYNGYASDSVNLKYIFIPEVNDNNDDIDGFVNICKQMQPSVVLITYDFFNKNSIVPKNTLISIRYLISLLKENNILYVINSEVIIRGLKNN